MRLYSVPADAKESIIWFIRTFRTVLQILPVFGFNSAKYDLNLFNSYLLPILMSERDIEPTVIKKANQSISSSVSRLVIFSSWLKWMNEERRVLILSWNLTKLQRPKVISLTNGLMTSKNCKIQNLLRIEVSSVKSAVATPSKQNTQNTWTFYKWSDYRSRSD